MSEIIDAHVHVFPPEFIKERDALVASEPVFGQMYGAPSAKMVDGPGLLKAMDAQWLDRAVVCGFSWTDPGRTRDHNDYILELSHTSPERLIPLAAVSPVHGDATAEADRALAAGAKGLGELGAYAHDMAEPEVASGLGALCNLSAHADRPVMLHVNEPVGHQYPGKAPMGLRGLYDLIRDNPTTRFQLAHLGGGLFFFELLKKEVSQVLRNCVFDLAAVPFLYRPEVIQSFWSIAGPDRLLYGSDYPLIARPRYEEFFKGCGLSEKQRDSIMGGAASSFWKI